MIYLFAKIMMHERTVKTSLHTQKVVEQFTATPNQGGGG
jgi:hypothetical protein